MKSQTLLLAAVLLAAPLLRAQAIPEDIEPILEQPLQSPQVVTFQLQQFLMKKVPKLPDPQTAGQWTAEAQRIRRHLLQDVIFHGWPPQWVNSPPRFEDLGTVSTGKGYQLHKLRYEIVPGFYSTALLYEPDPLKGRVPAVLDVMGHFPEQGNKIEFEQKLCINQALKGMIALNPEWIGMGELHEKGNEHWFAAHLDLVGMNGVGLFYLAMRRGLDYLSQDANVDSSRIGMTGLSGGGWQTITLSSLDPRVDVSIPVAGYTTLPGRFERLPGEPGDLEQNASDFLMGQGYATLTAMRAPRPTLLIFNAEDNCCFRAPLVKPYVFDPIQRFFKLYGRENQFQFYQNTSISAHNYGLDNRQRAYGFLVKNFHLQAGGAEIPTGQDLKTYRELTVGIPKGNLTILGLARKMAAGLSRQPVPSDPAARAEWSTMERTKLRSVVRYHPVTVAHAWEEHNTDHNQVESLSYRFEMDNALGATGVWLKQTTAEAHAPLTIVLNDRGKKTAAVEQWDRSPEIAARMERGEQILAADLLFMGDDAPTAPAYFFTEMLAATGERPLGMEAAQLIALAAWAQGKWAPSSIRLETKGIRSQVISLVAASLKPHLFSEIENDGGMSSLSYLLEKPVTYEAAPDLFCLDLYKDFDIDQLEVQASPSRVIERGPVALSSGGQ
ncbi:MAG: alpha/beta hydrolase family protein [Terriglobia bacterium]